jgi:hypothetical protein
MIYGGLRQEPVGNIAGEFAGADGTATGWSSSTHNSSHEMTLFVYFQFDSLQQ